MDLLEPSFHWTQQKVKDTDNMKEGEFNPEFTHQVFGDNELITGYANLSIKV